MVKSLYGTELSEKRCIGFCWKHHCALSTTQLRQKECLRKGCDALERYNHEYWRQRELFKLKKKEKRGNAID